MTSVLEIDHKAVEEPWREIKIAHALGLPLYYGIMRHSGNPLQNISLENLSIDPDPDSSTFGQSILLTRSTGVVAIIRGDGQNLYIAHVEALFMYIEEQLEELGTVRQREAEGEKIDRQELAARLVSKEAFKRFWEAIKDEQTKSGPWFWDGAESPV
jgi:hypothetical protein